MRIRVTFSKTGPLRYIGHLDLSKIWERAARRAGLPLAYTQGFHPQPKINLASALPLGFSSRCELVDLHLKEEIKLAALPDRLQTAMPEGIRILDVANVEERQPALQMQVTAAEYEVTLTEAVETSELKRRIEALLAGVSLPRERRGKTYDLRPLIEKLTLLHPPKNSSNFGGEKEEGMKIFMRLTAREGATGRPDEVLTELGYAIQAAHIERTALITSEAN